VTASDAALLAAVNGRTPAYVYDADVVNANFALLDSLFGRHFGVSYAVKANPNVGLLRRILPHVDTFDVSSFAEMERALAAGCPAARITFSGPAKRPFEIDGAVRLGLGELVIESLEEAERADAAARAIGREQPVLIRINPATAPKHFGVSMAGKASQFGVDEEVLENAIDRVLALPGLELIGFHIYSGTNSLRADAIAENMAIFRSIFRRAAAHAGIRPRKLVFGSGFGVPYTAADAPLDVEALAAMVLPEMEALKKEETFADARCILEMGRWLVGPAGWLLTGVVAAKESRGTAIRACDAGFNNHLAAAGMMGTVIRRNWRFRNLSNSNAPTGRYLLVGPLCTTIDVLATDIELPEVRVGDVLAIANSGAYGLTASPTRFISHPEPAEFIIDGGKVVDTSEPGGNGWQHPAASDASDGHVAALADG
jgi:diaminopimelate decarboxylase